MCQQKKIKFVAVVMAMSVLFTPLLSILEIKQTVNVVHAEEATVSAAFFGAVLAMMGITAFMQGTMSSTFSIPETDLLALKDQFAQTLEADAAKKSAWMQAQTDYLAGGVAKTMGATELAKIGVNDIYTELKNYLKSNIDKAPNDTLSEASILTNYDNFYVETKLIRPLMLSNFIYTYTRQYGSPIYVAVMEPNYVKYGSSYNYIYEYDYYNLEGNKVGMLAFVAYQGVIQCETLLSEVASLEVKRNIYNKALTYGVDLRLHYPTILNDVTIKGAVTYNNTGDIINTNTDTISVLPTIPWIDNTVPVGTIVNPEISAPYAGTVPIEVPITAPIDPPIEEPETPSYPDVLSATLAILAALTPISAILDNIDLGIGDIDDVIDAGNTAISDGIGDIIDTITGSVTDIGTIVEPITSTLDKIFDPPSKDIDWDKLKNIEIFNKFPFSIPADLYFLMSMLASDPVAPMASIDLDLSFIGAGVKTYTYDLSQFDNFAQVLRSVELLAFVFFLLYSTKNLIWK